MTKGAVVNPFQGLDDYMEAKEPGYRARNAAWRAKRAQQAAEYRRGVVEKYGSEAAALAPCKPGRALSAALEHLWRNEVVQFANGPHRRNTLAGWWSVMAEAACRGDACCLGRLPDAGYGRRGAR